MSAQKTQRVQKARAIVIKEEALGESNKRLTLLAKDAGKLIVSAKGAKNQKSRFLSGAQQFCYCDFLLYDGGGFQAVTQIDLLRNFSAGYADIFKLMYGSYFLELIDKTVMLAQESNDIMLLLLRALHMLEKTEEPEIIASAFQIKLLDLLGFSHEAHICGVCGAQMREQLFFSKKNGFVCGRCNGGAEAVPPGVLEAYDYIKATNTERAFLFTLPEALLKQLSSISEELVKSVLEMESKSLEIIKKL